MAQEIGGDRCRCLLVQLDESELRGPIYGHEHMQLALLGSDLGDVDMEVADWIGLELLPCRLVALDIRQPAYPVTLQAAMQG